MTKQFALKNVSSSQSGLGVYLPLIHQKPLDRYSGIQVPRKRASVSVCLCVFVYKHINTYGSSSRAWAWKRRNTVAASSTREVTKCRKVRTPVCDLPPIICCFWLPRVLCAKLQKLSRVLTLSLSSFSLSSTTLAIQPRNLLLRSGSLFA